MFNNYDERVICIDDTLLLEDDFMNVDDERVMFIDDTLLLEDGFMKVDEEEEEEEGILITNILVFINFILTMLVIS